MAVSIVNTWTSGYAPPSGFSYVQSATNPAQAAVANAAGDWLVTATAWLQPLAAAGASVAVADDVHNWHEPAAADSPAAGLVRCSLWAAPAARAAAYLQSCPTAPVTSIALAAWDVAGIGAGWAPQAIASNYSNSATSLVIGGGTAAAQSLVITILAANEWGATITPPAGWTALTGSTIEGLASPSTESITVAAAYQVITGTIPSATWSVSGSAIALAGRTVAIPLAAAVPALKSPDWPAVITEMALGAGPQSAPSSLAWTDLSARSLALSVQQGRQYTLSQLQAAQGTITLDNPDGALIPPGTGSFAGLDSGTPLRRRCYWPGGAWQVQFSGNGTTASPQASTGNILPVSPGVSYTASAWIGASAGWSGGAVLILSYYTSGGSLISSFTSSALTGTGPVLATATGTSPSNAALAAVKVQGQGTPPATTTFFAAAAEPKAGWIVPAPGVSWLFQNGATGSILAAWKPDPRGAPNPSPWSVPFSGFFRRWPFTAASDLLRGETVAEISDIWAYASGSLDSMARQELLIDQPYALWPLDDSAGAPAGSNIAQGNGNPLTLVLAKLGAGGATQQWGASSGALLGDSSAKVTQSGIGGGGSGVYQMTLAGTSLNTNGYGYSLTCTDTGFPPLSGNGVTIETWFSCDSNTNTTGNGFGNSGNTITVTGSSFANGTPVVFTSSGPALPTGMTAGTIYYVINQSGATFQISATIGGSAVTLSTNSVGFCATTTSWNPSILALRTATGTLFSVNISNSTGNLFISGRGVATTTIDTSRDWRLAAGLYHLSVALTTSTWRVTLNGGGIGVHTGSMASPPATWDRLCLGGVMDRLSQGFAMPGQLALAAVYPYVVSRYRTEAHYFAGLGLAGDDAQTRIDRVLGYAGLAGRRWIGQQGTTYEVDTTPSGQDIGGQSAATSAGNIAASTVPALLYIAPTGDTFYAAKQYQWNNAIDWTLGDSTTAGEIPFSLAQMSTDYDPTRVYNDIQLSELDTQTVTVPAGRRPRRP